MKTLPLFWPNPHYKKILGTALSGLCLFSSQLFAQNTPLATPKTIEYPGIIQTFEKLIQIDTDKFNNRSNDLMKNGRLFSDSSSVTSLDLEPDFLNSVILHSKAGYIKLASQSKCSFYDTILTDLLRSAEGKITNVIITYVNKSGSRESSVISRKDFLTKVVSVECPETQKLISEFQIKNIQAAFASQVFEIPSGQDQCQIVHASWLKNPKTPYMCQIYEYLEEARKGLGDPNDLTQRRAVARVLEQKITHSQKDYLSNLCNHLDDEVPFCEEFLNVSFWNKVAAGLEDKIYAHSICAETLGIQNPNDAQLNQCLARMKKESDLCLFQNSKNRGLSPQIDCDALSVALNYSSLRSNYPDCPIGSDQLGLTNVTRILLHKSKSAVKPFEGSCSVVSAGEAFEFNERFDNDESWKLQACFDDKLNEKEVCYKTFFGSYNNNEASYTQVVANILKNTRGADPGTKCSMVESRDYNPLLLQFKSGCYIIYEASRCFMSQCKHKIIFNARPIDFITIKNDLNIDYFPTTVQGERFSQNYLLTHDYKLTGRPLNNLTSITAFFKKSKKAMIHGVGCGEDLLPSFFKSEAMGQCTPVPFIIDGMIKENDKVSFVTRTSMDSLQAPRIVSWSNILSTVKMYQRYHPLRIWTLYGLD